MDSKLAPFVWDAHAPRNDEYYLELEQKYERIGFDHHVCHYLVYEVEAGESGRRFLGRVTENAEKERYEVNVVNDGVWLSLGQWTNLVQAVDDLQAAYRYFRFTVATEKEQVT